MIFPNLPKSNLHTHTSFCDGADSPEEIVLSAIAKKMDTLGFSGHSTVSFDPSCSMDKKSTALYREEVMRLRNTYSDQLNILLGIERDFYSEEAEKGYDFVIGSVHYLCIDGKYLSVDYSKQELLRIVNTYFGGDFYRFAREYFSLVATLPQKTDCSIIGHFDLLTKFNADGSLFDEKDPRYLRPAIDALDRLLDQDMMFEINTGAIARGYRNAPYPAPIFLHRIAERRGKVTLSSDAHSKSNLTYGFEEALHIARASGLGAIEIMTRYGWRSYSL